MMQQRAHFSLLIALSSAHKPATRFVAVQDLLRLNALWRQSRGNQLQNVQFIV